MLSHLYPRGKRAARIELPVLTRRPILRFIHCRASVLSSNEGRQIELNATKTNGLGWWGAFFGVVEFLALSGTVGGAVAVLVGCDVLFSVLPVVLPFVSLLASQQLNRMRAEGARDITKVSEQLERQEPLIASTSQTVSKLQHEMSEKASRRFLTIEGKLGTLEAALLSTGQRMREAVSSLQGLSLAIRDGAQLQYQASVYGVRRELQQALQQWTSVQTEAIQAMSNRILLLEDAVRMLENNQTNNWSDLSAGVQSVISSKDDIGTITNAIQSELSRLMARIEALVTEASIGEGLQSSNVSLNPQQWSALGQRLSYIENRLAQLPLELAPKELLRSEGVITTVEVADVPQGNRQAIRSAEDSTIQESEIGLQTMERIKEGMEETNDLLKRVAGELQTIKTVVLTASQNEVQGSNGTRDSTSQQSDSGNSGTGSVVVANLRDPAPSDNPTKIEPEALSSGIVAEGGIQGASVQPDDVLPEVSSEAGQGFPQSFPAEQTEAVAAQHKDGKDNATNIAPFEYQVRELDEGNTPVDQPMEGEPVGSRTVDQGTESVNNGEALYFVDEEANMGIPQSSGAWLVNDYDSETPLFGTDFPDIPPGWMNQNAAEAEEMSFVKGTASQYIASKASSSEYSVDCTRNQSWAVDERQNEGYRDFGMDTYCDGERVPLTGQLRQDIDYAGANGDKSSSDASTSGQENPFFVGEMPAGALQREDTENSIIVGAESTTSIAGVEADGVVQGLAQLKEGRAAAKSDFGQAHQLLCSALGCFEEILEESPEDSVALGNSGNALLALGSLKTDMANVMDERGSLQEGKQLRSDADELLMLAGQRFRKLLMLNKDDNRGYMNWAKALCARAKLTDDPAVLDKLYGAAIAKYEQVLSVSPATVSANLACGLAYRDWSSTKSSRNPQTEVLLREAVQHLQRVLKSAPSAALKNAATRALADLGVEGE